LHYGAKVGSGALFTMSRYIQAILYGLAQWLGEAVIGVIPLFMYELVNWYSKRPILATCPDQTTANQLYFGCSRIAESPSQEICILAVVISGLAVLSIVPIGNRPRRDITIFTRVLVLVAIIALIVGSLFYAFFAAHLDHNADVITYWVLAVALISSLCLAVEDAILSA
jgi:hypothetical protein